MEGLLFSSFLIAAASLLLNIFNLAWIGEMYTKLDALRARLDELAKKDTDHRNAATIAHFGYYAPWAKDTERATFAYVLGQGDPDVVYGGRSWELSLVRWVARVAEEDPEHGILWYQRWPTSPKHDEIYVSSWAAYDAKHTVKAKEIRIYLDEYGVARKILKGVGK
jgi:hypothetical protein